MEDGKHDASAGKDSPVLRLALVFGPLVLARLVFMRFLPPGAHSTDVDIWVQVARVLESGGNPYNETTLLKYPPLWMLAIFGIQRFARATGLSFLVTLQLVFTATDCGIAATLLALLRRFSIERRAAIVLVGVALDPISLLLTCQHGNHDVLLGLWVLLAVLALLRWHREGDPVDWLGACAFLGIGVVQKTIPLVLAPLLLVGFSKLAARAKVLGALLLLGPAALGLGTIYVLGPEAVAATVFGYRSYAGYFGFTGLAGLAGVDSTPFATKFFLLALAATAGGIGWLATRRKLEGRHLVLAALVLLACVIIFGPGYGPQYVSWLLPLVVACYPLFDRRFKVLIWVSYAIATATYLVEYALCSTHGAFLVRLHPTPAVLELSERLGTRSAQTLVRLPLFLAYLALFGTACRILARTPQAEPEDRSTS